MDVEGLTDTTVHSALSHRVIIRDELDVEPLLQTLIWVKRDPLGGVSGVFLTDARSKALIPRLQRPQFEPFTSPSLSKEALVICQEVTERFKNNSCLLWIGYGCRGASALIRQLAERYALPVIATPHAKGISPENYPLYQGTAGLGESANHIITTEGPKGALLLGSKAAELSSMFIQEKWTNADCYCIGLETSEVKRNMPKSSKIIKAEISLFLKEVLGVKSSAGKIPYPPIRNTIIQPVPAASRGRIHTVTVMSVVQSFAINGCGCSIISDAANLYWTAHDLKFPKHGLYRSNLDSSPMGHAVCGVVDMGLGDKHAVAIVSDAAMLMQLEGQYCCPIWIEGYLVSHEWKPVWYV
jgi:acetolactate synthase-1/2/3 large subunit